MIGMSKSNRVVKKMSASNAQIRAVGKYNQNNYDDIKLRVPKGYRDNVLRVAADAAGMSLNEYILSTVASSIKITNPDIEGIDMWKISRR